MIFLINKQKGYLKGHILNLLRRTSRIPVSIPFISYKRIFCSALQQCCKPILGNQVATDFDRSIDSVCFNQVLPIIDVGFSLTSEKAIVLGMEEHRKSV